MQPARRWVTSGPCAAVAKFLFIYHRDIAGRVLVLRSVLERVDVLAASGMFRSDGTTIIKMFRKQNKSLIRVTLFESIADFCGGERERAQMHEAGQKLRQARERLRLRYRDVEEASQHIANQRGNHEFLIVLSRLADIENKGTVPSVYRLYSLCAIYGLDFATVLRWYGIELEDLPLESARLPLEQTHVVDFKASDRIPVEFPLELSPDSDFRHTSYLSRHIRRWGKVPIGLLNALDLRRHRYAFIGTEDWSMYPILWPGSFIQIDETRRRVAKEGWSHEHERPIYFVEHRYGYLCGWCTDKAGILIVQAHSSSQAAPQIFRYPGDAEVLGQVVGVAMRLDQSKRRHTHS